MSDAKDDSNGAFPRRAFINRVATTVVGAMLIPTAAACQQSESVTIVSYSDVAQEIDAFIKGLTAEDKFSGAVLVAKDGKAIFKSAYGLANKEFNVPNQVSTRFNVASMGKMFTGVAVAQLAE